MSSASKSGLTEPRNGKRSEPYTSDKAAVGRDHPSPLVALDHLGDQDMAPRTQPWPSALPRVYGIAASLPNGLHVRHQTISTEQEWSPGRPTLTPLQQSSDQGQVPLRTDLAAQPPAGLDHHGQRPPHAAALLLDAELVGLHLPQVPWSFD